MNKKIKRDLSENEIIYEKALDYVDEATAKANAGKLDEALKLFDTSLSIKPIITAYVGKAKIFAEMGDFDKAFALADQAKKDGEKNGMGDFIDLFITQLKDKQAKNK